MAKDETPQKADVIDVSPRTPTGVKKEMKVVKATEKKGK